MNQQLDRLTITLTFLWNILTGLVLRLIGTNINITKIYLNNNNNNNSYGNLHSCNVRITIIKTWNFALINGNKM